MATVFDEITDHIKGWVERQALFFVGSAPLDGDGHVNVSPKGPIGSLRVLGPHTVAYLEVTGSGSETIAHLRENGRIVVMLCAFEGPPRIVRFHGRGEIVWPDDPRFDELMDEAQFEDASVPEARRSIILVHVKRVSDACGYGVPVMEYVGQRDHHALSTAKKLRVLGADGYREQRRTKNRVSLDGLPAVDRD
ncbi:MAG: pyridoxamine 5'-phosphate oxidase family protein [Solirubrobacteraceae bacterium]|nr:pyridoxamine 5'-phosphate oxidase family protein [Patulibacter sp.]